MIVVILCVMVPLCSRIGRGRLRPHVGDVAADMRYSGRAAREVRVFQAMVA